MSEPLTDAHLELIRRNAGLGLDACPAITGEVLAEVDRLKAENATLRALHEARCERVAAAHEVIAARAERDALARLEAWEKEDETHWKREVQVSFVGCWRVRLSATDHGGYFSVEAMDRQNGREPLVNDRYHEIHVGTDDKPATLTETVLAALDLWQQRYGEQAEA